MTTSKTRFLEILRIKAELKNRQKNKDHAPSLALRPDQEEAIKAVFEDKITITEA